MNTEVRTYDEGDQIVFSDTFNLYTDQLKIENLFGFTFQFTFEKDEPKAEQPDIKITTDNKEKLIAITVSRKFRTTLGSSSSSKLSVLKTEDGSEILFSIYGQAVTNTDFLNVTINFYLRKRS